MARRQRRQEPVPVAEPIELVEPAGGGRRGGGLKERPARLKGGPSFAMPIAVGAGACAAVLAFAGALAVAKATEVDPVLAMDEAGVQAVRMLAVVDMDRLRAGFGTSRGVRARVSQEITRRIEAVKKSGDDRDVALIQGPIDEWKQGVNAEGTEWRPGFDQFFPPDETQIDDEIELARTRGMKTLGALSAGDRGAFVGAAITDSARVTLSAAGDFFALPKTPSRIVGKTEVFALAGMRAYRHPVVDRRGNPAGNALVILSARNAKPPLILEGAAAAAGGAFLGGFLVALIMGMGVVKSIRLVALDAEAVARGDLDTRVHVRGPDVVQATAKALQKVAHMAAESSGPVETQIVTQQVAVLPVDEIHEGLGPRKGFQRPQELEVEATAKVCPESGNDYHDYVNIDDEHVGFIVADVPVHGIRGALYMNAVRALFRQAAQGNQSPADVLRQVNRGFAIDLPRGVYVTAMYVVVNVKTGVCRVASAQHLPLVFWKLAKKGSARLQTEGIALGLDSGSVFDKTLAEKAVQLEKGDRIVLFTDGAINAKNAAGATYGEERFYYVVNREAPKNSAAFVNFVANDVDLYHDGAAQLDDFTVLTIRRVR